MENKEWNEQLNQAINRASGNVTIPPFKGLTERMEQISITEKEELLSEDTPLLLPDAPAHTVRHVYGKTAGIAAAVVLLLAAGAGVMALIQSSSQIADSEQSSYSETGEYTAQGAYDICKQTDNDDDAVKVISNSDCTTESNSCASLDALDKP